MSKNVTERYGTEKPKCYPGESMELKLDSDGYEETTWEPSSWLSNNAIPFEDLGISGPAASVSNDGVRRWFSNRAMPFEESETGGPSALASDDETIFGTGAGAGAGECIDNEPASSTGRRTDEPNCSARGCARESVCCTDWRIDDE